MSAEEFTSDAQVVDFLCKGGVVLCNSACIMCDEGESDAVVSDINVGMVAGRLGELGHVIDERHGGDEVLEGALLDEFTVLREPNWGGR